MLRLLAAAGLVFLAAAQVPSEASTVSGSHSGYITDLNFGIPQAGAPAINLNDPYTVQFTYDTTDPVYSTGTVTTWDGFTLNETDYTVGTLSVTVGAFHFSFNQSFAAVTDSPTGSDYADDLRVWSCASCFANPVTGTIPGWSIDVVVFDAFMPDDTFNSTDLPTSAPNPANDFFQITLKNSDGDQYYLFGADQPLVAATPIPASAGMMLTALGGLGFVGWTRRRA